MLPMHGSTTSHRFLDAPKQRLLVDHRLVARALRHVCPLRAVCMEALHLLAVRANQRQPSMCLQEDYMCGSRGIFLQAQATRTTGGGSSSTRKQPTNTARLDIQLLRMAMATLAVRYIDIPEPASAGASDKLETWSKRAPRTLGCRVDS